MKIEELYASIGGNYNEVHSRLISEKIISKFICKFPNDPTFGQLMDALMKGDEDAVFRAVHTLKGVCANLGLTKLSGLASDVTEMYRPGQEALRVDEKAKVSELKTCYEDTIAKINQFAAENGMEV